MNIELQSSDYNSRNPESCNVERCQICRFANELQNVGDRIAKISVADINEGKIKMPFTQRTTWLKIQKNDKVHQQLSFLIDNYLAPEKRKTKGDNTLIKRLHNMYKVGKLRPWKGTIPSNINTFQHVPRSHTSAASEA